MQFLVEEIREAPRQCACPNGEQNCVCPSPEILEPTFAPKNSPKVRRSAQQPLVSHLSYQPIAPPFQRFSQYPSCPCPQNQPACTCSTTSQQNEQILVSISCCQQDAVTSTQAPVQMQPCQCSPSQIQAVSISRPDPPTHITFQNCQTTTTQQQYCPQQSAPVVQPQPCPLGTIILSFII